MPRRLLAVLALPVVAAACGGSKHTTTTTTNANAAPAVHTAVTKTAKAGSEHVALSASSVANGQHVTISGSGDFDSAKHLGKLSATATLGGVQTKIDEVLDGSTAYVSAPIFGSLLPSGKSWLKIDLAAAGKALGIDTSVLSAQDPASALEQLKAIRNVKKIGRSTVAGVPVTEYRGTVDVSKLPAGVSGALATTGASLGPYDVWVGDRDGYVHRVRLVTKTTSNGQTATTTMTMTLSDFGESVLVSPPPASQTVDAGKLSIPGLTG